MTHDIDADGGFIPVEVVLCGRRDLVVEEGGEGGFRVVVKEIGRIENGDHGFIDELDRVMMMIIIMMIMMMIMVMIMVMMMVMAMVANIIHMIKIDNRSSR